MSDFIRYAMEAGGRLADQLATAEKRVNQLESENAKLLAEVAKLKAGWRTLSCSSLVGLERETQERKGGEA